MACTLHVTGSTKKIYPTPDELKTINSSIHCTEEGCLGFFTSESNLNLHLVKTHKKESLLKSDNVGKEYYCPEVNCVYNNTKYFKTMKLLKQHFLKVHGEKKFMCQTCDKGFPSQSSKNAHADYCGVNFKCCDCRHSYFSYESLITHGRRKRHAILEKVKYKLVSNDTDQAQRGNSSTDIPQAKKETYLLPKYSTSLQVLHCAPLTLSDNFITCDKSSQTDLSVDFLQSKLEQLKANRDKQIGYLVCKKQSVSIETQTVGDYITRKSKSTPDLLSNSNDCLIRNSIKTQTKPICYKTKSCNTSFNISEFDLEPLVQRNSSSTQTNVPMQLDSSLQDQVSDMNFEFMHSSSQTSFKEDMDTFNSSSFYNCRNETQTDLFDNELLDYSDLYSNMCTQTYDNILKIELGVSNSHTQTALDDMLRSVESQTLMSKSSGFIGCRDMTHMETQTDAEFKQILEEINA